MGIQTVLVFTVGVLYYAAMIWGFITFRDDLVSTLVGAGLPRSLAMYGLALAPHIPVLEIGARWSIWSSVRMKPLRFIAAEPEQFHLDQAQLDRQTAELEQLGFVQLMDYISAEPIGGRTAIAARLLAHPEQCCFAIVGGTKSYPVCSMSSFLEQDWDLTVLRASLRMVGSTLYGFHHHPRKLFKILDRASPSTMFQTLLEWRSTVISDLGITPIRDIQADAFFENLQNTQNKNQDRLIFKESMIWCYLKACWASLIPQTEWLGDYKKYQGKRSR